MIPKLDEVYYSVTFGSPILIRRGEGAVVIDICYLEHAGRIHLLYLFSKGEQADLSPQQKQIIGALSQEIRKES